MSDGKMINTRSYWNQRFAKNWDTSNGPAQSRNFARLTIERLPRWLIDRIKKESLTLADWGCAQGDGADVWAGYVGTDKLTGIDFSSVAVEKASRHYRAIRFVNEDWMAEEDGDFEAFDVVFSSNTLEHFYKPYDALRRLSSRAKKSVILALPYREMDRNPEHFFSFLPENIPLVLPNGFRLVWSDVADCRRFPDTPWPGDQIILVYADPEWIDGLGLALSDCRIVQDDRNSEISQLKASLAERDGRICELNQVVTEREGRIAGLNQAASERDGRIAELSLALSELDDRIDGLNRAAAEREERIAGLSLAVTERDDRIDELNRAAAERDGRIAELTQAVSDRDGQIVGLKQTAAELNSRIAGLSLAVSDRDGRIAGLNQAVSDRDGQIVWLKQTVFERDDRIDGLNRALAERDSRITELNQAVVDRDGRIASLSRTAAENDAALNRMKNSNSWHITQPLRFIARTYRYGLLEEDRRHLVQLMQKNCNRLLILPPVKRLLDRISRRLMNKRRFQLNASAVDSTPETHALPDYIMWGVIDWHFRHQRPQQLALALARTGRRVFYVSSNLIDDQRAGFDHEALDASDRLFQIRLYAKGAPSIYSAAPAPETVNQLRESIGEFMDWADCRRIVSMVQHPFWCDVACVLPDSRLVYDCMDYHEGFGNTGESLAGLEKELFGKADLTITSSAWLDQTVAKYARSRVLIRNAGEYAHFSNKPDRVYQDPMNRRIIGYYGAIAEWFDLDLVEAVAKRRPDCCVLLIGADTVNARSRLENLSNVRFVGEAAYGKLPYYLHGFDVCLLPFKVAPLTLATNPVKAYEYLSAGKPVVAVKLPEMAQFDGLMHIAEDRAQFLKAVDRVLSRPESEEVKHRRRVFAQGQTWTHRAEKLIRCAESNDGDPKVSVIVVAYNNLELTRSCLLSLDQHSHYENLEIIAVDNASSDGTPEYLEKWASANAGRKIILNASNRGFAAANNQGLNLATGDFIVLLNNDTYVTPGWVRTLVGHLRRDKNIGLIGPVTNNIGNEARIDIAYMNMGEMIEKSAAYTRRHIGQLYPLRTAAFFCVMMRRDAFEQAGPLDEAYELGFFEDDDYCRRIEKLGLHVACAEDVFIHHHLSASFNALRIQEKQKLFDVNKAIYETKWGPWVPHEYRRPGR